ncbi:hypothetical protein [Acinetobacter defluvii]|uniref:hypothetical protein n=1 Tax=Acinetobacter defluvii TaxID=1871111 RepID=UPI003AF8FC1E
MIRPSLNASLSLLQALTLFIDKGSANATFVFYDDAKPTNTTITASELAKLVTLELEKPSFKKINADSIELMPTTEKTVIKTGTAIWARLYNGEGQVVADFDCVTDMTLNTRNLVLGGSWKLDSITFKPST